MKNKFKLFGVITLITLTGIMFIACDDTIGISVRINPDSVSVGRGGTHNFTAIVTGNGIPQNVEWSVSGFTNANTSINSNGVLTVAANETSTTLTVHAALAFDTQIRASAAVTVSVPMTLNTWTDGNITSRLSGSAAWYSFDVVNGETYYVWWNDSVHGNGTKTLDVNVSASYSDGTSIFTDVNSGWTTARQFNANRDGTVIIRVAPQFSGNTGTFAVAYSRSSTRPELPVPMTLNTWTDGIINSSVIGSGILYTFDVDRGTTYYVWWNDRGQGDGTKDLDVSVSASYSDGTPINRNQGGVFTDVNHGWTTASSFTADRYGTVIIRVTPSNSGLTGTFAITYTTRNTIPTATPIPLTMDTWEDGEFFITTTTADSAVSYTFNVVDGDTYYIWWNDSGQGNTTKTLDVSVSAFYIDGTSIFSNIDSGWTTARQFNANRDGTVIIRVAPQSRGDTGTFAVAYTTSDTKPEVLDHNNAKPLTINTWEDGSVSSADSEIWYSFDTVNGTTYSVWWNDLGQGNGTKDLDVMVSAFYSDGTSIFTDVDHGWTTASSFTADRNGTVIIRVSWSNNTGTFAVAYNTINTRPPDVPPIHLTLNTWEDGSITSTASGSTAWYSFDVVNGETYYVWWNDSINGNSTKDLDVRVSAFYSDGTPINRNQWQGLFTDVDLGWDTANSFTADRNDTIIIIVSPMWSNSIGTFAVAYSTSSTRPPLVDINNTTPLTINTWTDGIINSEDTVVWYSFDVNIWNTYYVWWNDSQDGNGTKDLDVSVSAFYSDGTPITTTGWSTFSNIDSGWSTASAFYANRNGTVIIRVAPQFSGNTGTFAVAYSTDNAKPALPVPLSPDTWTEGSVDSSAIGSFVSYAFDAVNGETYHVWWNDSQDGNGTKDLDVMVSAFYSDGTPITTTGWSTFSNIDSGWTTARSFNADRNDTVIIIVSPVWSNHTGTFAVVYSTSSARPPVLNSNEAITLPVNTWVDGNITSSDETIWYSFDVVSWNTYHVWWNDSQDGNWTKDLDVMVSAFYSDGTPITTTGWSTFSNIDSGWTTARSFNADRNDTVIIIVSPVWSNSIGTFAVAYNTSSTRPTLPVPLTFDTWTDGSVTWTTSGNAVLYSFDVDSGTQYHVWWNDSDQGNWTKTLDVSVSAFYSDGTSIFTDVDHGWSNASSFTADRNGTVIIRVTSLSGWGTGTFAVAYSTSSARPTTVPIPLTQNIWTDGSVDSTASGSAVLYSFDVVSGTQYRVWWNDSDQGNWTKTLDVSVSAFYSDGTPIFTNVDSGWNNASSFFADRTDTLTIRVAPRSSSSMGTFALTYSSTSSSRPTSVPIPLSLDTWTDGNINTTAIGSGVLYSFDVDIGYTYYVWWNDSGEGNGTKNLNVRVHAFYSDGSAIFADADSGWDTASSFTADRNGTVTIRVAPWFNGNMGTFAVAYSTDSAKP